LTVNTRRQEMTELESVPSLLRKLDPYWSDRSWGDFPILKRVPREKLRVECRAIASDLENVLEAFGWQSQEFNETVKLPGSAPGKFPMVFATLHGRLLEAHDAVDLKRLRPAERTDPDRGGALVSTSTRIADVALHVNDIINLEHGQPTDTGI
jgi:hypothetical protein